MLLIWAFLLDFVFDAIELMANRALKSGFDVLGKFDGADASFGHAESVIERIAYAIDDLAGFGVKISATGNTELDLGAKDLSLNELGGVFA